jgi:iron complex outermembrane receptor protein
VCGRLRRTRLPGIALALALSVTAPAAAQTTADALKRLTLEEMMNLEVSTVSRAPQRVADIPAAVHVITRDDIRRAGVVTLPEALRLAPGVQVARIDGARYAIGIRGFADRLARSMLVMIDGRAVYSSLFAGTYWEVQDMMLEDVERIEVIRGPGGTLWGANAVNGIINIVTRHSRDTQGAAVRGAVGGQLRGMGAARFGGATGEAFSYRVYGKSLGLAAQLHDDGADFDEFKSLQFGARTDWVSGSHAWTVQGDVYRARLGQRTAELIDTFPFSRTGARQAPLSGGNVLARWSGTTRPGGSFQLQGYYDRANRDERPVAETRDTVDLDFQQTQPMAGRHTLIWGLGYRRSTGRIRAVAPSAFTPDTRSDNLFSAFIEDDVSLVANKLRVVAGVKVEHNDYSGAELQPSARLIWHLSPRDTLVTSVTRAVRTPSRVETDYTTASVASPAVPSFVRLLPNPDFRAEELIAYEVGYRTQATRNAYLTFSGFFNQLDHMVSTELLQSFVETTPAPPRLILPVMFRNGIEGQSHGVEVTGDVRPTSWWRWTGHYSYARVQVSKKPGSADVTQERRYENLVPRHQAHLHSSVDLPGAVEFDWTLRYVSRLPFGAVPAYTTSDVRLAWLATPQLELSVVGRNLHQSAHLEWAGPPNIKIQRSAYLSVVWRR